MDSSNTDSKTVELKAKKPSYVAISFILLLIIAVAVFFLIWPSEVDEVEETWDVHNLQKGAIKNFVNMSFNIGGDYPRCKALSLEDESFCYKLKETNTTTHRTECLIIFNLMTAIKRNDPSYCEKIPISNSRQICKSITEDDLNACSEILDLESLSECKRLYKALKEDITVEEISDEYLRAYYYMIKAVQRGDTDYCEKIDYKPAKDTSEKLKFDCLSIVQGGSFDCKKNAIIMFIKWGCMVEEIIKPNLSLICLDEWSKELIPQLMDEINLE